MLEGGVAMGKALTVGLGLVGIGYFALAVQAGTVIQQEGGEPGGNQPKQKITLYIDAGKLRVDGQNPDGKKFIMIFDQDKQVVWNILPDNGTYMEMTPAQMEAMSAQMSQAMQKMQAQLAQMPPEQRKMMEEMMKRGMGGAASAAPTVTVQEKGKGEKVGPFATTHYEVQTNGQRSSEVWAASPSELHLQDSDFKTFQAMAKFYEPLTRNLESLTRNVPKGSWSPGPMQQIQGFPVRTVTYEGPRAAHEWSVTNVGQRSLESSLFTLPPGLKKQEMMGPGGVR